MFMPHSSRRDWNAPLLTYCGNHCTPCVLAPRSWNACPCESMMVGAVKPSAVPTLSLPCLPTGVWSAETSLVAPVTE